MSQFEPHNLAAPIGAKFGCSGWHEIPRNGLTLFYGKDENASRVDLDSETATEDQLQNLFRACDAVSGSDASFGSLQPAHFSSNFNLERSGLLRTIRSAMLDGYLEKQGIEAEISELNVYSKDSHCIRVKDVRVSERMFASLIVVFPTGHEGGNMVLSLPQEEYLIDFADMLKDTTPCVGYAAFFCDVERTVSPIVSGHCVTMKYNLYLRDTCRPSGCSSITTWNELAFRETLSELLSNPSFLTTGGQLGYSLRNHYSVSVPPNDPDNVRISTALPPLRGVDAVFKRVCEELSLLVTPHIVYNTTRALVLSDKFYPHEFLFYEDKTVIEGGHQHLKEWDKTFRDRGADLQWVSELRSYGNDYASYVPGGLCLCVEVGPAQRRSTI